MTAVKGAGGVGSRGVAPGSRIESLKNHFLGNRRVAYQAGDDRHASEQWSKSHQSTLKCPMVSPTLGLLGFSGN